MTCNWWRLAILLKYNWKSDYNIFHNISKRTPLLWSRLNCSHFTFERGRCQKISPTGYFLLSCCPRWLGEAAKRSFRLDICFPWTYVRSVRGGQKWSDLEKRKHEHLETLERSFICETIETRENIIQYLIIWLPSAILQFFFVKK